MAFFVREALRSLRRNAVPSFAALATVLVTMLVLGVFIPVVQATTGAANEIRRKVVLNVYMKRDATAADLARVRARIEGTAHVKKIQFVSKAQAYREQRKRFGDALELLGSSNPLPDAFRVTPDHPDAIVGIGNALAPAAVAGGRTPVDPAIDEVRQRRPETTKILIATRVVKLTAGGLALLLIAASTLLIANTIRLSLFARRREVEVMKLVGATDWFIRWPFVLEGVILGAVGGVLAILLLAVAKIALIDPVADNFALIAAPSTINFGLLIAVLIAASVAISAMGSGISLRRFLRV